MEVTLKNESLPTRFPRNPPPVQFNKKLLDFDYGSDDEDQDTQDPVNPQTLDAIKVGTKMNYHWVNFLRSKTSKGAGICDKRFVFLYHMTSISGP